MTISHWDEKKGAEIKKRLIGVHPCCVNTRQVEVDIREVQFFTEGEGANRVYRKDGGGGTLAVLDIGYNTLGFSLYNGDKQILTKYEENSGVREIITRIETDQALLKRVGYAPSRTALIDALIAGGRLSSNTSENGSIDITDLVKGYKLQWLRETLSMVKRRYGTAANKVSEFWIIGGGANLLKDAVKGTRYHVPECPEFVNAEGMAIND